MVVIRSASVSGPRAAALVVVDLPHRTRSRSATGTVACDLFELRRARNIIEVREDGRSTTTHEITNIMIEIDEEAGTAVGHAYWTLYQTVSGTPRQPVLSGRYHDRFERCDGQWRFAERNATSLWKAAA